MKSDLPHHGVWCRLGVSALHGVGVFAIEAIPKGSDVFANEREKTVWIEAAEIERLPQSSERRRLYSDFAIRRGTMLGCPANFNLLTVGWYVNQPILGEEPNLEIAKDYAMIARRDIEAGEELTIVYSTFSR